MTKSDLRNIIRGILKEELANNSVLHEEAESVKGPGYAIKAWYKPESKAGIPIFDSVKKGILYKDFSDVVKALNSSELSEFGAYEITWIKS